jgi:hypothetical protein
MPSISDRAFYDVECFVVTTIVAAFALAAIRRWLGSTRPGLAAIGWPLAAAFGLRVLAAVGVSLTSVGESLRGGDEPGFVFFSRQLADQPLSSPDWTATLIHQLYKFVFAAQFKILDSPELALRVTQGAIATVGILLLATAVYELAGPRVAVIAAWLLALEPASVFFSGVLHKEPLLFLAEGLVAFGGASLWTRGKLTAVITMASGCAIGLATRPYAGWFLVASTAAISLHGSLRLRRTRTGQSLALLSCVVLVASLGAPAVYRQSTTRLEKLQSSQAANANDESNLKLEQVDYSSPADVVAHLPRRVSDLLLRPYPWQVQNTSQQLGAVGSLFAFALLVLLVQSLWRNRGEIIPRAGPLVYLGGFLLVAYALSVGNAGTGFRYRTHLVALGICLLMTLRARHSDFPAPVAEEARPGRPELVPAA